MREERDHSIYSYSEFKREIETLIRFLLVPEATDYRDYGTKNNLNTDNIEDKVVHPNLHFALLESHLL